MKILIVDDKKETRYLLETLLKVNGYDVVLVANGAEALGELHTQSFDMIIADILMPVMDGFQLCCECKKDGELKNIPFVFYTATYTDEKDEELALECGADKFIRKPMEPDEFIKNIKSMIEDVKKGKVKPKKSVLEEEKEVFKLYSERLVKKLENKMLELEREVTEHKQTEQALQESEEKYRSLTNDVFDSSAVGIFILDSDFRIVWVNQSLERYFGLRRDEVIGKDKRQLIREQIKNIFKAPESFAEKVLATYDNNTYIENFECHALPNGEREECWLEHWSQPIRSGLYAGGRIEHYYNITERKRMEVELQERRDANTRLTVIAKERGELQGWINTFDTFVGKFDPNGVMIFCNEAPIKAGGLTKDDVFGKYFPDTKWWSHSEIERARIVDCFERAKTGLSSRIETNFRSADGTPVPIIFNCQPVMDDDGKVKYITAEGKIIIEEVKLRNALQEEKGSLEKRVKERTSELVAVNEKLKKEIAERKRAEEEKEKLQTQLFLAQKMEAIGTLAGGVAHDFNNLLTVIQGYTNLAIMEISEDNPVYHDLEEVQRASIRAANLTRQLLLFSRQQPMEFTWIDINSMVENLLKMLQRLIGEDIAINTDLEPDLWTVQGDVGNIEQIIMNLAVNARDAMPEGGKLSIKTEKVTLDEESCKIIPDARPGKYICLSIADTGVGMDEEICKRIFEPFFTTKKTGEGTGLGLSVVYGIVKQHEGWINVYSEPGQGSTLNVYLPASSGKLMDETEETISLQELGGNGERILLVEDDERVRGFAREAISKNGYVVFEAADAQEALDIFEIEKGNIDLIFSDVVLPDKNSLELVDQFLSRKPELMVLLSSGYADQKSQWPIIRKRGFPFLQKPYSLPNLLRAVREVIEQNK